MFVDGNAGAGEVGGFTAGGLELDNIGIVSGVNLELRRAYPRNIAGVAGDFGNVDDGAGGLVGESSPGNSVDNAKPGLKRHNDVGGVIGAVDGDFQTCLGPLAAVGAGRAKGEDLFLEGSRFWLIGDGFGWSGKIFDFVQTRGE